MPQGAPVMTSNNYLEQNPLLISVQLSNYHVSVQSQTNIHIFKKWKKKLSETGGVSTSLNKWTSRGKEHIEHNYQMYAPLSEMTLLWITNCDEPSLYVIWLLYIDMWHILVTEGRTLLKVNCLVHQGINKTEGGRMQYTIQYFKPTVYRTVHSFAYYLCENFSEM
jgi:hypothetical protein